MQTCFLNALYSGLWLEAALESIWMGPRIESNLPSETRSGASDREKLGLFTQVLRRTEDAEEG